MLSLLLKLMDDPSVSASVKVLFTSTPGPNEVRGAFEADNLILNVDVLPQVEWTPSNERVVRQLGEGLDERVVEYQ